MYGLSTFVSCAWCVCVSCLLSTFSKSLSLGVLGAVLKRVFSAKSGFKGCWLFVVDCSLLVVGRSLSAVCFSLLAERLSELISVVVLEIDDVVVRPSLFFLALRMQGFRWA